MAKDTAKVIAKVGGINGNSHRPQKVIALNKSFCYNDLLKTDTANGIGNDKVKSNMKEIEWPR